ncbi:hypothetical protein Tco_1431842, partial [Tanacetum coccineum]
YEGIGGMDEAAHATAAATGAECTPMFRNLSL